MEFMSTREAADKWGISQRRVAVLCSEQRIAEATRWVIVDYTYFGRKTDRCKKYKIQ